MKTPPRLVPEPDSATELDTLLDALEDPALLTLPEEERKAARAAITRVVRAHLSAHLAKRIR